MLNYILLLISLALGTGKNLFSKWGEKSFGSLGGLMSVNILTSLLAVLVFAVSGAHLSVAGPFFRRQCAWPVPARRPHRRSDVEGRPYHRPAHHRTGSFVRRHRLS